MWKIAVVFIMMQMPSGETLDSSTVYPETFLSKEACETGLVRKYLVIDQVIKEINRMDTVKVIYRKMTCERS